MSGDNAAHFAAGQLAGRQQAAAAVPTVGGDAAGSAALNSSSIDPLDARAQAVLGNGAPFYVERSATGELRFMLHLTENFFDDFALGVLYIVLIGLVALAIIWAVGKVWRLGFGFCGFRMSCVRISQSLVVVVLAFVGVALAFGAAGVSLTTIFGGLAFISAGWIVGTSQMSMDFVDGLRLTSWNVLEDHHRARAKHLDLEGEILSIGYLSSEFNEELRGDGSDASPPSTLYRRKTTLVRNSILLGGPLEVWWHTRRPSERPVAIAPNRTAPRPETVVAAERGAATTRFAPHAQVQRHSHATSMSGLPMHGSSHVHQSQTAVSGVTRRMSSLNAHAVTGRLAPGTKFDID